MQTAALVYRPPMPAFDEPARYADSHSDTGKPKGLRVLAAGHFNLPLKVISDRLLRVTSRATASNFQIVLNLLVDLPHIDLVVLEASLPGFESVEDLRRICDLAADTPVVIVCNSGEEKKAAPWSAAEYSQTTCRVARSMQTRAPP